MRGELFIVTPKKCIFCILYVCILFSVACSIFGMSRSLFYLCDIFNLLLLYFELKHVEKIRNTCAPLFYILIALLIFLVVVACINFVKPQLVFWGIRNLCRFYILFFGVILFFTIDDVKRVIRFYFVAQIFNVFVGIYKYFVLGLFSDDFGGGIFVTGGGLDPFCLLLLCFYSNLYFAKRTTFKKFAFIVAATFMLWRMLLLLHCYQDLAITMTMTDKDFINY